MLLRSTEHPSLKSKWRYYLLSIPQLLLSFSHPWRTIRLFVSRQAPTEPSLVAHRQTALSFWIRSKMDLWTLKETLVNRYYERCGIDLSENAIVIDIGAAFGDFTLYAARRCQRGRIFAFEPVPASFALLERNIRENKVSNVTVKLAAVGNSDHQNRLVALGGSDPGSFSLLAATPDAIPDSQSTFSINWLTLETVLALAGGRCDVLKLDCEGGEYDIILNSSVPTLRQIEAIALEFHEGLTQWSRLDLKARLESVGFTVTLAQNPVHQNLGYLWATRNSATA